LEYLLLFGLPENKTEIIDGLMPTLWPFETVDEDEAAVALWSAQLERLYSRRPKPHRSYEISRAARVVEARIPVDVEPFCQLTSAFWQEELWDQPTRRDAPGYDSIWRYGDLRMNLWQVFDRDDRHHWRQVCWGDVMVADGVNLYFDLYYFKEKNPLEPYGDFASGVPDFIAQILLPATREADRNERLALMHRVGISTVWLLDPLLETVDVYAHTPSAYVHTGTYRKEQRVALDYAGLEPVAVESLFRDRGWKERHRRSDKETAHANSWLLDAEQPLGLEAILLLGHPGRRHEIWGNTAPCVLAFGSAEEAKFRLRHFLEDAALWVGSPPPSVLELGDGVETARIGQFEFTRRSNRIYLHVEIDPRHYRALLHAFSDDTVWDEFHEAHGE
jgi:hypothetical protein